MMQLYTLHSSLITLHCCHIQTLLRSLTATTLGQNKPITFGEAKHIIFDAVESIISTLSRNIPLLFLLFLSSSSSFRVLRLYSPSLYNIT